MERKEYDFLDECIDSRLYEFSLTPLLFLAAGSLTAVMKPLNEKQLTVKNSE